tara:strand:+ start:1698 stop:2333 length:636 start_codon:yes stop_codon:yes gene_type:complete
MIIERKIIDIFKKNNITLKSKISKDSIGTFISFDLETSSEDKFFFLIYDQFDTNIIRLASIKKCTGIRTSDIIKILISTFKEGLGNKTSFQLGDTSKLKYFSEADSIYISLSKIFILSRGITWYESLGFTNLSRKNNEDKINNYICRKSNYDNNLQIKDHVKFLIKELKKIDPNNREQKEKVCGIKHIIDNLYQELEDLTGEIHYQHFLDK